MTRNLSLLILIAILLLAASGCDDERVVHIATQAADRQAEQNRQMAQLQQEVAAGTKSLVEETAATRQDVLTAHHELHNERMTLGKSWNDLESQRQKVAQDRRGGALLLAVGQAFLGLLIVLLVLGFCRQVLAGAQQPDASEVELQELLVDQLVDAQPRLPAAPRALSQHDHEPSDS